MKKQITEIEQWIKNYVYNAKANGVVVGMSGGKDSFIVAKLCANALGDNKVFGIIMPNGNMVDKNDAVKACEILGINYKVIDINNTYSSIINNIRPFIEKQLADITSITTINTAPRVRMATLYAIAGSLNCLVVNTSNLSETMVGYSTKWGDNVGDFAPLANYTKTEVCEIGLLLNLSENLVNKAPSDGLSGKSDEEKLGFSYKNLDDFIRTGNPNEDLEKILKSHSLALHKINGVAKFENNLKNFFYKN